MLGGFGAVCGPNWEAFLPCLHLYKGPVDHSLPVCHLPCCLPAFAVFYVGHQTHMHRHTLSPSIHTHTQHFLRSHFVVRIDCSNYCFMTGGPVELTLARLLRVSLLWTFALTVSFSLPVSAAHPWSVETHLLY